MKELLNKRDFTGWALKLAFPIMIQNLISTLVNSADTIMLGFVSQTAMSASSLANQFTFVLICIYYGLETGTSVLVSQYWGKKDIKAIEKVTGIAVRWSLAFSLIFFAAAFFFPEYIMTFFSSSKETILEGSRYLRVLSFSFLFMSFSQIYLSTLRSVESVVFPTITYIVSLCVNIFLNATFIFGFFGMPKMGIVGVAIGTVAARAVETLMCIVHSFFCKKLKFRIRYVFEKAGILGKDFLKVSFPAMGNDLIWGLASSMFSVILGHMGDDIVAANAVANMLVNVGAIACRGFANATTIIVGKTLGENNYEATKVYAVRMLKLTVFVSLLGCGVILLLRPFALSFYSDKLTETAINYLGIMMIMTTWRLVGEGINTSLICGCFRGGGDTKFGLITDTVFMWLVALPLMAIAAYVLKLPAMWVYFVMTLDEIEKLPVVLIHFRKYQWLNNITRQS